MKILNTFVCNLFGFLLALNGLIAQAEVLAEPSVDLIYDLKQSMVKIGTTTK